MTNAARLTDYKKNSVSAAFGAGVPMIKNHIGGAVAGQKAAERDAETNAATGRREESRSANAAGAGIDERDEAAAVVEAGADAGGERGGTPPPRVRFVCPLRRR